MSVDQLVILLILPLVAIVLIAGWLFYLASGSRPVRLTIKGLGLSISIDAKARAANEKEIL